jgi:hypothetical protein
MRPQVTTSYGLHLVPDVSYAPGAELATPTCAAMR